MYSYVLQRPADVINRKRPFAVWFPYTAIQQLWCKLEELIGIGHMVDQCEKLKKLLHGALLRHLELVSLIFHLQLVIEWLLNPRLCAKCIWRFYRYLYIFSVKGGLRRCIGCRLKMRLPLKISRSINYLTVAERTNMHVFLQESFGGKMYVLGTLCSIILGVFCLLILSFQNPTSLSLLIFFWQILSNCGLEK